MSGGGASEKEGLFEGDPRLLPLVIATGLALFAVQLDFFSVQTALPSMAADLDTSVSAVESALARARREFRRRYDAGGSA